VKSGEQQWAEDEIRVARRAVDLGIVSPERGRARVVAILERRFPDAPGLRRALLASWDALARATHTGTKPGTRARSAASTRARGRLQ
jgi:hypothetical protein